MQTSDVSALEAHSCFPRTNPAIVLILFPPFGSWLCRFLPKTCFMRLFSSKYVAARRYQSRMALRVTTRDENESLSYRTRVLLLPPGVCSTLREV